jgi:hypothetical protein
MKKIFLVFILMSTLLNAGVIKEKIDFSQFDKISRNNLAKIMTEEILKGIQLPMRLDYMTRLIALHSYNSSIIFRKEVDINNPNIKTVWNNNKDAVIQNMLKIESQFICNSPMWKYMIYKRNIIPEIDYVSTTGKELVSFTIEVEDCNKLH